MVSTVIAQTKIKGLGATYTSLHPPLFFCLGAEEFLLGLCGLWQDPVPLFQVSSMLKDSIEPNPEQ